VAQAMGGAIEHNRHARWRAVCDWRADWRFKRRFAFPAIGFTEKLCTRRPVPAKGTIWEISDGWGDESMSCQSGAIISELTVQSLAEYSTPAIPARVTCHTCGNDSGGSQLGARSLQAAWARMKLHLCRDAREAVWANQ
jgi:hypothetical protein